MAILIILQFNSFRRTAIIMLTIPLVLIGAVLGLWIGNAFLSFTAILGMFSLAGIVINNGIILIDKADIELQAGATVTDAIHIAANARLRPILITTLTTIIGLLPMALFGGNMWYPMSIVIIFGLLIGTVLTLGVVPILYFLFNDGKIIEEQNTNIKNNIKAMKPITTATAPRQEKSSSPPEIDIAEHEYENSLHDPNLTNVNNNATKEDNINKKNEK
jgi:predicted RND superfamily exporter protein